MSLNHGYSLYFDVDDAVHQQMTNWRGPFAIAMNPQTRKAHAFTAGQSPDSMRVRKGQFVTKMDQPWIMLVYSARYPDSQCVDNPAFGEIYSPDHGEVTEAGRAFALEKGKAPTIEGLLELVENPHDIQFYKAELALAKRIVAASVDDTNNNHPTTAPR